MDYTTHHLSVQNGLVLVKKKKKKLSQAGKKERLKLLDNLLFNKKQYEQAN